MAERSPGAGVVRRRLGSSLRRLRERADIRLEAAASELECSPAKISRLENGQGPAKLWDVRILLDLYGVEDSAVRRRHENWARGTKSDSWWESDADLTSDDLDRYFASETEAASVQIWCTPVLPVILQTRDYAAAHMRILFPTFSDADIARLQALQRVRQDALLRRGDPLKLEAVVDEAAVLRRVGTAETHAEQLRWIARTLEEFRADGRDDLEFRIVPLSAGPGRALCSFTIFRSRHLDTDPATAFLEDLPDGGTWLESGNVQQMVEIFDELRSLSVDTAGSIQVLRDIAAAIARGATP